MKKEYRTPKSVIISAVTEDLLAGSQTLGVSNVTHQNVQGDAKGMTDNDWDD